MTFMSGVVKSVRFFDRLGPEVTVDLFPGQDNYLTSGQPVMLSTEYIEDDPRKEAPMTAGDLTAAHLGARVRVRTLSVADIEDRLEGIATQWNEGRPKVFLQFRHLAPADGSGSFPVLPTTPVTITREPGQ